MDQRRKVALWTMYGTVSVYSLAYMAQVPLLPYLLKELGVEGSSTYGTLQTTFSLAQLLGGLLSGPLVDRWGGRSLLLISLISSVASYALTASATSLTGLYLSRGCTVMQHAILAARTYVAATAPPEARARLLGYVGVSYGLGFAVGPALGGVVSQYSGLRTTAWAATLASVVSVVAVLVLVPAGHNPSPQHATHTTTDAEGKNHTAKKKHSWLQPLQVLKYPAVRQLVLIKLATGLAGGLLQSVFTLMLKTHYNLNSKHNGMVLSFVGMLTMISQALLVDPASRLMGESGAVYAGCVAIACSYLIMAATPGSLVGLMVSLVPGAAGGSVMSTINTAQLTQAAPHDVVGSVLALDMSLFAAVRLCTPVVGTALLDTGGVALIGCTSAGLVVALLVAMQIGWIKANGGLPNTAQKTK